MGISLKLGLKDFDVKTVIDGVFAELKDGLASDRIIELRGFGTFQIRTRKRRSKARNPKTGASADVAAHGAAAFRPGKELKQAVWPARSEGEQPG